MHNEINALRDRALDLASITKISLDYAAGPLLAQFSPAGHLIQQESWQGQRGGVGGELEGGLGRGGAGRA